MPAIIVTSVWKDLGFVLVLFLAGLQAIPNDYYEAAALDGANRTARFRYVTLPLLGPTTFFVVIISLINSFQVFDQVWVMTEGGPAGATTVLVEQIVRHAFSYGEMGYAAAISWVLFALVLAATLVQFRLQRMGAFDAENSLPTHNSRRCRRTGLLATTLQYAPAACIGGAVMLIPFLWMLSDVAQGARRGAHGAAGDHPQPADLDSYRRVMETVPLARMFGNSLVVTVISVTSQLGHVVAGGLRLCADAVARAQRGFLALPGDPDGAFAGDDHAALYLDAAPWLGGYLSGDFAPGMVSRVWHLSAAPGHAQRAARV